MDAQEFFDPPEEVISKIHKLAELIRNSKHVVLFTGAGISTSAGIPDFRGNFLDKQPKLSAIDYLMISRAMSELDSFNIRPTRLNWFSPRSGVWTLRDKGIHATRPEVTRIQPTKGHMVIVRLFELGHMKYLISQNTDGLHVRSGIPFTAISELHGNANIERCPKCERSYWRKFEVREAHDVNTHQTSRRCDACGRKEYLEFLDLSFLLFSVSLPKEALQKAFANSHLCDLHIVLGSSLTVSPANDLPQIAVKNHKPLVIVNLQRTPLDDVASLRIFARTDEILIGLCKELGVEGYDQVRDLKSDSSFNEMIIMPNATRRLNVIKEAKEQLREWSVSKLLSALRERGFALHMGIEKDELINL
ncbi:1180_t:CDS:2 [Acaulospora colombiana]|uniref:1180_t:CDS:1 n=1 Tax=Acaulospora colombiana TaxID=27376 RepID=A0ACA9K467_9GLOM|nr:1180_t:CDS:2 [Acaulospora colombiana]